MGQDSWRKILANAVKLASEDPDAFMLQVREIARRSGRSVEELYVELQKDPRVARIRLRNSVIKSVATKIKEELDL